jgi:hypothetical protein
MCFPLVAAGAAAAGTTATISTVATIASTAIAAYGAYSSAQAQKRQAEYNAQVAQRNKEISEWQAQDTLLRGEKEAQKAQHKAARIASEQLSAFAKNNISVNSSGVQDTIYNTETIGEIEGLNIRDNAGRDAFNYRQQAYNYGQQSQFLKSAADNYGRSSYLNAYSSLLSGVGTVADKWYKYSYS